MNDAKLKYKNLIQIISKACGEPIDNLRLDTTINIDLKIYGDDWDELMRPILDKYPIDEFSAFEYSRHMRDEGDFTLLEILNVILFIPKLITATLVYPFSKKWNEKIIKSRMFKNPNFDNQPLYLADIYNSILKGKWEYAKDSDLNLKQLSI